MCPLLSCQECDNQANFCLLTSVKKKKKDQVTFSVYLGNGSECSADWMPGWCLRPLCSDLFPRWFVKYREKISGTNAFVARVQDLVFPFHACRKASIFLPYSIHLLFHSLFPSPLSLFFFFSHTLTHVLLFCIVCLTSRKLLTCGLSEPKHGPLAYCTMMRVYVCARSVTPQNSN